MAEYSVDELLLQVSTNASSAIQSLSSLQTKLRGIAKDIGTVGATAGSLDRVHNSLFRIANLDVAKITRVTDAILKLNDLSGKTINVEIKMQGASEAERKVNAIQTAINNIDTSSIARKLADSLGNQKYGTYKKMLDNVLQSFASGNGSSKAIAETLIMPIEKASRGGGLKIPTSFFDDYVASMKSEYQEFLDYLKNHPIALTRGVDDKLFFENATAYERMNFFSKEGAKVDTAFADIVHMFPGIMAGMEGVVNEEDMVYQLLTKIREAMSGIGSVDIKDLTPSQSESFWQNLIGMSDQTYEGLAKQFNEEVDKAMRESRNKIPLNVAIDSEVIKRQIQAAVDDAASKPYKLNVGLAVDTKGLKGVITRTMGEVKPDNITGLSEAMKDISKTLVEMDTVDLKGSGINSFINALGRLGEANLDTFNTEMFAKIVEGASSLSKIDNVSNGVNRLIAALARLASAGKKTEIATNTLPALGDALKEVIGRLSSAGGIPAELNAFVSAISGLANAGNKTGDTAEQLDTLADGLLRFMSSMQNAPQVSANVIQFTSALAQLANASGKAGTAGNALSKSLDQMKSKDVEKAMTRFKALGAIVKTVITDMYNLLKKGANAVQTFARKIISHFDAIKKSSKGLFSVSDGIKSVIGGLIGFRGLTGIFNFAKEAVMMGADITEIDHIVESVFSQDMIGYVDNWAKAAIEKFGIAEHSAKRYAGTLSAMFQASSVDVETAGRMATKLTGLAGDLSAFFNIDTETAFNKIRSGMAGMVRPLRDLGIDMTAATLKEYALSQGITKSYQSMTQAEKVMLRYGYLMTATAKQQGDFVRTSGRSKRAA